MARIAYYACGNSQECYARNKMNATRAIRSGPAELIVSEKRLATRSPGARPDRAGALVTQPALKTCQENLPSAYASVAPENITT